MPRVNRDLQRRLAARRERERRRPAPDRRYRFQTAQPEPDVEPEDERTDGAAQAPAAVDTPARGRTRREGRTGQIERPAPRPFLDYRLEYAYVGGDLRRLGLVVGAILIVLLVLNFVLPR